MPAPPLPIREGLNPTRLHLPPGLDFRTSFGYLVHRFPADEERLAEKLAAGEIVAGDGTPIDAATPYRERTFLYLYRDVQQEIRVPFEIEVLHRDDALLVVDKPHFLSTMPRGRYVVESALVRLRRDLDLPTLSPAHRLDRLTAGVLIFTVDPAVRGAYQTLFADRRVRKVYEAIAPFRPGVGMPTVVRSRIIKERGVPRAQEVPGPVNAESFVELQSAGVELASYRLLPSTGRTHQLRLHMHSLGLPIVNDNFYPDLLDVHPEDYSSPLQLLARSIEFTDPLTGAAQLFESRRTLDVAVR